MSRLIKALDNRFYLKFMQLEIGLFAMNFNMRHNEDRLFQCTRQTVLPKILESQWISRIDTLSWLIKYFGSFFHT